MKKMELISQVLISDYKKEDKLLLVELLMRMNDEGECWPSVARLCKVRGIKHEKNFHGADYYLPGLVTKVRRGKGWTYVINTPALEGVTEAEVTRYQGSWKQRNGLDTPAVEEVTPAVADNTPAVEGVHTPAVEGVDSTGDSTRDSTEEDTTTPAAIAAVDIQKDEVSSNAVEPSEGFVPPTSSNPVVGEAGDSSNRDTPATEGALEMWAELIASHESAAGRPFVQETRERILELCQDKAFLPKVTYPVTREIEAARQAEAERFAREVDW